MCFQIATLASRIVFTPKQTILSLETIACLLQLLWVISSVQNAHVMCHHHFCAHYITTLLNSAEPACVFARYLPENKDLSLQETNVLLCQTNKTYIFDYLWNIVSCVGENKLDLLPCTFLISRACSAFGATRSIQLHLKWYLKY